MILSKTEIEQARLTTQSEMCLVRYEDLVALVTDANAKRDALNAWGTLANIFHTNPTMMTIETLEQHAIELTKAAGISWPSEEGENGNQ